MQAENDQSLGEAVVPHKPFITLHLGAKLLPLLVCCHERMPSF